MKQFFKQYIPYYKNYKLYIFIAVIGMVMVSIGTAGTAYIIKPVLDEIFINKDVTMLQLLPIIVIVLYGLKGFGKFLQTYYVSYIGMDIIKQVRNRFLSHILTQDISFFNSKHGGELLSRVNNDINMIQGAVTTSISTIILEFFTIIGLIGVVIYQSPKLAFYGLVVIPLVFYPLSKLAKRMKKLAHQTQQKASNMMTILGEIFNNIELIIANNSQSFQTIEFQKENQKMFDVTVKGVRTNALISPLMEIIGAIAASVVIIVGGMEVINGNISVGAFFSFMTALFMLYTPIKRISSFYNQFQVAIASNERINDIFDKKAEIVEGNINFQKQIKKVFFEKVFLNYVEKEALVNVTLTVEKGETLALVGDSGGGKSSLVNLILRFYDPSQGIVKFNDIDIKELTFKSLRDNIAIVTQRVYIFNDTIANNIAFGQDIDKERVIDVLKQAHAWEFVNELEDNIDTMLDESGSNLSGGQRQRIAIARALYKNPQILIFDEATSALDNESESMITQVLDEVSKDRITFVIAHRLSTIKNADKIAVFKNGRIVCLGNEAKLLETCEEYKRLYNLASK